MIVYQYSHEGLFECITEADESPLEPGVFLIPARCTTQSPPNIELLPNQQFKWNGEVWEVVEFDTAIVALEKLKEFLRKNPDVMELISK